MKDAVNKEVLIQIKHWFDSMPNSLVIVGASGDILYVNGHAVKLFGYEMGELIGQSIDILVPKRYMHHHADLRTNYGKHPTQRPMGAGRDLFALRKDGSEFPVEIGLMPLEYSGEYSGEPGVVCSVIDISERKKAETEKDRLLRELDIRNDKMTALYRVSELMRIGEINEQALRNVTQAARAGLDHTSVKGVRVTLDGKHYEDDQFIAADCIVSIPIDVQAKRRGNIEAHYENPVGDDNVQGNQFIDAVAKIVSDAIERIDAGTKLLHASKLAAVGELAAGVGHEINNPINGVINCAEILLKEAPAESKQEKYLTLIKKESERVAGIVASLLAFSRQDKEKHSLARLCDIVRSVLDFSRKRVEKSHILLQVDVPEDLPKILCRTEQLQQVVLNLIINSMHALDERFPGPDPDKSMIISAAAVTIDGGAFLQIHVEDHGCGIPQEDRGRIFEPFFSTKDKDKGTGLGLAVSDGIVKSHGGSITVESVVMKFTRITISIPVPLTPADKEKAKK